jgi:hypothetical protein
MTNSHTNNILNWCATDIPENFELNPNKDFWKNLNIEYIIEHDSPFRVDFFQKLKFRNNNYKKIGCFGCSCTFGVGLPLHCTWPYLLNKSLGRDYTYKNFGDNGASVDDIVRHIYSEIYIQNIEYDKVFILFPDPFRYLYFKEGYFDRIVPTEWCREEKNPQKQYLRNKKHHAYLTSEKDFLFRFIKNFKIIEEMLKQKNIKFYWASWSDDINNIYNILEDYIDIKNSFDIKTLESLKHTKYNSYPARDGIHYGIEYTKKIAEEFYKKINTEEN